LWGGGGGGECVSYAKCVLYETMIFVHILKCIPARYQHDEDAEYALVLGRRKVDGRDETPMFMYICRHSHLSLPAVPSMK